MSPHRRRPAGTLRPVSLLPPPGGGPARLYHLARLARVREALGPELRDHLIDLRLSGSRLTLVFAGTRWERAFRTVGPELRGRLQSLLARPGLELAVESSPSEIAPAVKERNDTDQPAPVAAAERLRRLAGRLIARREPGFVDRGQQGQ